MDELMNRKAVEHNDLVSSVAKMDKTPLKIFELAVSCIDTDNPPKDETVYLSKSELFSFFDVSSKSKNSRFKKAIETMQHQAFFEIREEQGRGLEYRSIVPIPEVAWNSYNDEGNRLRHRLAQQHRLLRQVRDLRAPLLRGEIVGGTAIQP